MITAGNATNKNHLLRYIAL